MLGCGGYYGVYPPKSIFGVPCSMLNCYIFGYSGSWSMFI